MLRPRSGGRVRIVGRLWCTGCAYRAGEVVDVSFVHGHARDTGWVMAHLRSPARPGPGQLPLLPGPVRLLPPEDPAGESGPDSGRDCGSEPLSSARKSAITRS